MKNNKFALLGATLSVAGFGIAYYLLKIYDCGYSVACYELATKAMGLFYSMPALAIVFLALALFPKALPVWKKFAVWFIPLAAVVFIFYKDPASGDLFSPYAAYVFKWVAAVYVVVSLGIIGFVAMRHSSQK